MKILAVALFLLGLLSVVSMTYVEGRGLEVASRFTGKSNHHENEYPLGYDNMKPGLKHNMQKEKDVENQKTSYGDGAATGEMDRNLSSDAKYSQNDVGATGDDDSGSSVDGPHTPDPVTFCQRINAVRPGTCKMH